MSTETEVLATALLFSFITCCVVSGGLQILAWARHSRKDASVSLRALIDPASYFDEVGLRQIELAKRLITVGAVAYAGYVALMLLAA